MSSFKQEFNQNSSFSTSKAENTDQVHYENTANNEAQLLAQEWKAAEQLFLRQGVQNTLAIFGSARISEPEYKQNAQNKTPTNSTSKVIEKNPLSLFYTQAKELAYLLSQYIEKHLPNTRLITGGGPGIMQAANQGAHQAQHASMGLNIILPHEQQLNPYIQKTNSFEFKFFATRKAHFFRRNRALIVFPGGFGTLDELFEALTLIQTGKLPTFPIILFGRKFWEQLFHLELLSEYQLINPNNLNLIEYADTAEEAFELLRPTLETLR